MDFDFSVLLSLMMADVSRILRYCPAGISVPPTLNANGIFTLSGVVDRCCAVALIVNVPAVASTNSAIGRIEAGSERLAIRICDMSVSYTHLTLPTSDLV